MQRILAGEPSRHADLYGAVVGWNALTSRGALDGLRRSLAEGFGMASITTDQIGELVDLHDRWIEEETEEARRHGDLYALFARWAG